MGIEFLYREIVDTLTI